MKTLAAAGALAAVLMASTGSRAGVISVDVPTLGVNGNINGFAIFPPDNPWNTPVDKEPVDPMSDAIIARIGADKPLIPEFGSNRHGAPFGIPYVVVDQTQLRIPTAFDNVDQSDGGQYPIPIDAPIETTDGKSRRRLIVLALDEHKLYEVSEAYREMEGWHGQTGAIFDLTSNELRPAGWESADEAGLPIFPGLARYDDDHHNDIDHALRFTVGLTRAAYMPPARHFVGRKKDEDLPPMGMRVRLKASVDISKFPPESRAILSALKKYGMILADTGDDWGLSGTADKRWDDQDLAALGQVKGSDFEVVEMQGLVEKDKK